MTDNPQPSGPLDQVREYQKLVLEYEALDEEIDGLLAEHEGASENMTAEVHDRYRVLARRRDEIYNQMKALESQILDDNA